MPLVKERNELTDTYLRRENATFPKIDASTETDLTGNTFSNFFFFLPSRSILLEYVSKSKIERGESFFNIEVFGF